MSLPVFLEGIKYKVAGEYAYEGELIVTRETIYYFPRTSLIQKSIDRRSPALSNTLLGGLAGLMTVTGEGSAPKVCEYEFFFRRRPPYELIRKLDGYIAELKGKQPKVPGSNSLPLPLKFEAGSIKDLSFSLLGTLSLADGRDTHTFRVWLTDAMLLKRSLVEAGFLSQAA
jgi:hypothetical protein